MRPARCGGIATITYLALYLRSGSNEGGQDERLGMIGCSDKMPRAWKKRDCSPTSASHGTLLVAAGAATSDAYLVSVVPAGSSVSISTPSAVWVMYATGALTIILPPSFLTS